MQSASYYRDQAARARRLLKSVNQPEIEELLKRLARDYDHIAVDLEKGAITIVHPELLPQLQ